MQGCCTHLPRGLAAWLAPKIEVLGRGLAAMVTINPDSAQLNAAQGQYTNAVCMEMLMKPLCE